jgi:prophage regulatory protein
MQPARANEQQPPTVDRLLREPEVKAATGLSRSQRHRMVKAGKFPAPVRISERASAWRQSQISEWLAGLTPAPSRAVSP